MCLFNRLLSRWSLLCLIGFSATISLPAVAQTEEFCDGFCLIENFDERLNGSIGGQGEWQSNPPGSLDGAIVTDRPPLPISGKALMIDPNGVQFRGAAYLPLNNAAIRQGSTGTLFFQLYAEDANDTHSHFGLSDSSNPRLTDEGSGDVEIYRDFEARFTLQRGRFTVKHGEDVLTLTNLNAASATLYNVWMVVNNSTDTYEVYVQGGAHSTVTKGSSNGLEIFDFLKGPAPTDLQAIYSLSSPNNLLHSKRYFDNLYVDPDKENLTNPVPDESTQQQFVEIDTFESLELGALEGREGWSDDSSNVADDPLNSANKVLQISSGNASKRFAGIADQEEGTLFFRMMRNGLVNASAGLSDVTTPTKNSDFENQVNVQNSSVLNIRDNGQFQSVDTFAADTWYCVWMMTDNSSDRYEVYMKGGTLTEPTRLDAGAVTDFSYRNGSDSSLSTFFARAQQSDGSLFIDDLYYSRSGTNLEMPGRNNCSTVADTGTPQLLTDPIPEHISKSGLGVVLEEFVTIPSSNDNDIPLARINFLDHANDNSGRLFVNDLRNKMYVIDSNSEVSEYLNVSSEFSYFVDSPGRGSGLGFFTFHPEFANNGLFYTVHTEAGDALANRTPDYSSNTTDLVHGVITEWTATQPDANRFQGSKREILRIGFSAFIHGFQQIGFNRTALPGSSDYGLLYIGTGDGQANPKFTASPQDLSLPHGKILRIDPLGTNAPNGQYGIPASNPFVDTSDVLGEIWAYGLRNPHRFSWDTDGTNKMFIGNIGEKNIDSIYPGFAGANYGWTEREGSFLFKIDDPNNVYSLPSNDAQYGYTYPVAEYDHDEGFAVVGGFVYRGADVPALNGKYIFGDVVNGRIFYTEESKMLTGERPTTIHELTLFDSNGNERSMSDFAGHSRADLRLGLDASGELYFLSKTNGKIWRMTSSPTLNNAPLLARIENQINTIGDDIFIAIDATDRDGDTLEFEATGLPVGLSINSDGEITGRPLSFGSFVVTVVVSDTDGTVDTERFELIIDAPEATPLFIAQIQSVSTGLCVGIIDGDLSDGANVDSIDCIVDDTKAAHQRLYAIPVAGINNTYTMEFEHSGLCLTVPENSNANGASLQQQTCNGSSSQQFRIIEDGANIVIYTGTGTGEKVIDSHAATHDIIQWRDKGSSNQRWTYFAFELYTVLPPLQAADDNYTTNKNTLLTANSPGVLDNDTDGLLTVTRIQEPLNGTLTLNTDGAFTYLPDNNFIGQDTFTYQATIDGVTHTNEATVTISIIPNNEPDPDSIMCNGSIANVVIANGDFPTSSADIILGTPDADTINGLGGDDIICGRGGDDIINGGNGNNWIDAGDGDDQVLGGANNDTIFGGKGNDTLSGGPGNDILTGNDGDDYIRGNSGNDNINGNNGVDRISGGSGDDTIFTGSGSTVGSGSIVDGGAGNDIITGGPDDDEIRGSTGTDTILGADGNDRLFGGGGVDFIDGHSGDDFIRGNAADDELHGGNGIDDINGGSGSDTLFGGSDNDLLSGSTGNDVIYGGLGDDSINGGGGNDDLFGDAGSDTIKGGGSNDYIDGGEGALDTCDGVSGTDTATSSCEVILNTP